LRVIRAARFAFRRSPGRIAMGDMKMLLVLGFAFAGFAARAAEMFPFVLPWDDAAPSVTDVSAWLDAPAGRSGFVSVKDGHLYANDKRLRIFGVNVAFGGNFPTHADAEKVAARMAKFGINCVRFHHMDMQSAPGGVLSKDMQTFDADQLDRLDYFIAQLKSHGIYADLNLHVSRTYPDRPAGEKDGNPKYDAGVDNFDAKMIALQKDYARGLLTHVNAYTKNAYTDEPAIAFIEINNENALLAMWNWGSLDKAAAPYRAELGALFTEWLRKKYGSEKKLSAAWAIGAKSQGDEVLKNAGFKNGIEGWNLEQHQGAVAAASAESGRVTIDVQTPGKADWHVQFNQAGIKLPANESYAVKFRAKADVKRTIVVNIGQAHEPWSVLASASIPVTTEWKDFSLNLKPSAGDDAARIGFSGLGAERAKYEFAGISMKPGGADGSVPRDAAGNVVAFTKSDAAGRTAAAQRDWHRFLWQLEEKYWPEMYRFIRTDLKAHSLIVGTQLGWSPFMIQQSMDVIDSHSYWQHPQFPRKSWDPDDWTVKNAAMTGAADGGTLPQLALQRVAGRPYICTEYNHSAPNQFSTEAFPLLCAYAALQDWDGVFAFAYSHRANDWDKGYFSSFFDIDQHPLKMATLPASLSLFMRGDVAPAKTAAIANIQQDIGIEEARKRGPRLGAEQFGVKRMEALIRRVGVRMGDGETFDARPEPSGPKFTSDTGELAWDTTDKVVTIDTPRSKGVIGFAERRSYDLGGVKIEFAAARSGFATVQLTVVDGADFKSAKRILITATGTAENTGMKWKSDAHDSVGREWGKAPSLVEGVAARITLPLSQKMKAWALDERGKRRAEVPLRDGVIEIGPDAKTLWYEIAAE
jgi:hypothetical protein